MTIEIKAVNSAFITSNGPATSPKAQALADIQYKSKISAVRPSDEVEALAFHVTWEPFPRVFGLVVPPEQCVLSAEALAIVRSIMATSLIMLNSCRMPRILTWRPS